MCVVTGRLDFLKVETGGDSVACVSLTDCSPTYKGLRKVGWGKGRSEAGVGSGVKSSFFLVA
jgi:hypothetical protein